MLLIGKRSFKLEEYSLYTKAVQNFTLPIDYFKITVVNIKFQNLNFPQK